MKKLWLIFVFLALFSVSFASASVMYSQVVSDGSSNWNWNDANDNYAWDFVASNSDIPANLTFKVASITGTPTGLVRITTDSSGSTTTYLANSTSKTITAGFNQFTLENATALTVGTKYWVFFSRTSSVANFPAINYATGNASFVVERSTAINQEPPSTLWLSNAVTFNLTGNPAVVVQNFTITLYDEFDNSSITNFTAQVNNINYTTTTGTVTTQILANSSSLYSIFLFNATNNNGFYFNKTLSNVNVSSNAVNTLSQTDIKVLGYEKITGTERTGSIWTRYGSESYNSSIGFKAGSHNVTWYNTTYSVYNKTSEFTFTALQNTTINISNIYNQILNFTAKYAVNTSSINEFNITLNNTPNSFLETQITTNGTMSFQVLKNLDYTAFINSSNFSVIDSANYDYINTSAHQYNKSFNLYQTNTINFTFKNELTQTIITGETIVLELISALATYNYSTTTGSIYASLLTPTYYDLRYKDSPNTNYTERFGTVLITPQSYNSTTLYLIQQSLASNITIIIFDENGKALENAVVSALRYYQPTNSYNLVEVGTTNIEGKTILSLQKNTEYYKFIVSYANETLKITNPAYITSDTLTISVVVTSNIIGRFEDYNGVDYSLSFSNVTDTFVFTWSDETYNQYCLYVYEEVLFERTLLNYSCDSNTAGSLLYTLSSPKNGTLYTGYAVYFYDSYYYFLDSVSYEYPTNDLVANNMALLIQLLLTLTLFFGVLKWNPAVATMLVPVSLIIGRFAGFNAFPITMIAVIFIVGIIITMIIGDKA